ncbi:WD40-repeat-containing domain protein [Scleroderma citrinum]
MLSIVTGNGIGFADPSKLRQSLAVIPVSTSLRCTTNAWASDNSQLYLASSSCIKRYTPSEGLLEEMHASPDPITCLVVADNSNTVIFAADNKVYVLDCNSSQINTVLCAHKRPVTALALSNDSSLLALVTGHEVFVHDIKVSSHTMLQGLPHKKVSCCVFHRHSCTKLLLGVEQQVLVYDTSKPSAPIKTIDLCSSSGRIVAVASSPFSPTLIAVATSNGDVILVDLDKHHGILKKVNLKKVLTALSFNAEGATIYLGTEEGTLMILNLRTLEREPNVVVIGSGNFSIQAINVQVSLHIPVVFIKAATSDKNATASPTKALAASRMNGTRTPVKYASATSPASDRRKRGSTSISVKPPVHVRITSQPRGGISSKKEGRSKPFSLARSPINSESSESYNGNRSEKPKADINRPPMMSQGSDEQRILNKVAATKAPDAADNSGNGFLEADTRPPESISTRMALVRARSSSNIDTSKKEAFIGASGRRITSESARSLRPTKQATMTSMSSSARIRAPYAEPGIPVVHAVQAQGADVSGDDLDDPSPKVPQQAAASMLPENVKDSVKIEMKMEEGMVGIGTPELHAWAKGKQKAEVEVKKARFLQFPDNSEDSDSDTSPVTAHGEDELSLQVSPHRPIAAPSWVPSHTQTTAGLNMNTMTNGFLQNIVREVMYEFQRETKAEMMGIHLDLVRMGRGWRRELREVMEEWGQELRQLREENKQLREENERLRRGF